MLARCNSLRTFAKRFLRQSSTKPPAFKNIGFLMNRFYRSFILSLMMLLGFGVHAVAEEAKQRIISLTPASTEILFALGLDDEIVGVSSYCNWPPQTRNKEKIGSFSKPNIEKIILLQADLVILTGMEQEYFKKIINSLDIEYIELYPSNLHELLRSIEKIGAATGRSLQAEELVADISGVIKEISASVSKVPMEDRPNVYVEIWHDPLMSIGKDSFLHDMIEIAGGKNITLDLPRSYCRLDPEVVILRNPNIIIMNYMKPDEWIRSNLERRKGWEGIDAINSGRVYSDIGADLLFRPGPRVKEGVIELHKRFYEKT